MNKDVLRRCFYVSIKKKQNFICNCCLEVGETFHEMKRANDLPKQGSKNFAKKTDDKAIHDSQMTPFSTLLKE